VTSSLSFVVHDTKLLASKFTSVSFVFVIGRHMSSRVLSSIKLEVRGLI
jgi:hypothetical protein